jgi:hypothetical protein
VAWRLAAMNNERQSMGLEFVILAIILSVTMFQGESLRYNRNRAGKWECVVSWGVGGGLLGNRGISFYFGLGL